MEYTVSFAVFDMGKLMIAVFRNHVQQVEYEIFLFGVSGHVENCVVVYIYIYIPGEGNNICHYT